ncbi:hypothetical protein JCM10207_008830 [Rhodosporidiobolus poonsookiae]
MPRPAQSTSLASLRRSGLSSSLDQRDGKGVAGAGRGEGRSRTKVFELLPHAPLRLLTPPLPVDASAKAVRASIDTLLSACLSDHYSDCASAVDALDNPAYPPSPAPEPAAEHGLGETGSLAQDVEGREAQVADDAAETAEAAEEALPKDEGDTAQGSAGDGAPAEEEGEREDKTDVGTPDASAEAEPAEKEEENEAAAPAAPVEEPEPKPEPKARPSRLFGLYFVGNKYNPSNHGPAAGARRTTSTTRKARSRARRRSRGSYAE